MSLGTLIRPRVCELGKIKIGGKGETRKTRDGGEYRLPVKFDHFVVTGLHRDAAGNLVPDQALLDGLKEYADPKDGKLRQLPVALLSNEIDDVLQASYVWYAGKRVAGRSDGKTCTFFLDPRTQQPLAEPREVTWDPAWTGRDPQGNRRFKLHTVFHCMIAAKSARFGGVYKLRTTSQITAEQLYGSLLQTKALTGGILRGVPLRLVVRPMQVAPPPDHKPTTVYVVHLEVVGQDLQAIQAQALERLKWELQNAREMEETRQQYRKLLAIPGRDESLEEQAEVAEEFHPPAIAGGAAGPEPEPPADAPADEPPTLRQQLDAGVVELASAKGVTPGDVVTRLLAAVKKNEPKGPVELDRFSDAWLRWSLDRVARWLSEAVAARAQDQDPPPADLPPVDQHPTIDREPGIDDEEAPADDGTGPESGEVPVLGGKLPEAVCQAILREVHDAGLTWDAVVTEGLGVIGRRLHRDAHVSGLTLDEAQRLRERLKDRSWLKDRRRQGAAASSRSAATVGNGS